MFSTILTAIDNSEHAAKAAAFASDIAQKYDAKLIFIHVIDDGRLDPELLHMAEVEHLYEPQPMQNAARQNIVSSSSADKAAAIDRARQILAQRYLEQVERKARQQGVSNIATLIENGDPARCILAAIERQSADLVVLGSRGLSDLKGLLLGSVSHKVCQLAPCTCITVK